MEYVISAIWSALELFCFILFNGAFLLRKTRKKSDAFAIVGIWIFTSIYAHLPINQLLKQLCLPIIYAGISLLLYTGTYFAHFFLSVICYIFIAAIDGISVNGMCGLLHIDYYTFVWRKLLYTTLITADKLIAVFLAWLLYRFRKKGDLGTQHSKWLLLSVLFPAISIFMFLMFFYYGPRDEDISISIVIFSGILMVANIAMLYIISGIEKATVHEQDARLLKQQISLQTANYNALKKNYNMQRKATHEFERHIQVLRDLLDREDFDSAKDYVRTLQANRTLRIFCINSNNPVVDVVLNQKHQLAQENGITMRVQVNNLSSISYQTDELVVLLSNLLDNAIEACLRLDGRREILCTILKEDSVYISIRNTSNPVVIVNNEIPTSKPDAKEHGFGIPAVKYILERLNAEYTFAYNDGWFQFVAEIP